MSYCSLKVYSADLCALVILLLVNKINRGEKNVQYSGFYVAARQIYKCSFEVLNIVVGQDISEVSLEVVQNNQYNVCSVIRQAVSRLNTAAFLLKVQKQGVLSEWRCS